MHYSECHCHQQPYQVSGPEDNRDHDHFPAADPDDSGLCRQLPCIQLQTKR